MKTAVFTLIFTSFCAAMADGACQRIYVANNNAASMDLTEFDSASNTILSSVPTGLGPREIAFTPGQARAYISDQTGESVTVIDTATNGMLATIPLPPGSTPVGITATASRVYVAGNSSHEVYVIDTASNAHIATITLMGSNPNEVGVSPDGSELYVVVTGSNHVEIYNAADNSYITTVAAGTTPNGLAFTLDNAYIVNQGSNDITVIDLATHAATTHSLAPMNAPQDIAITPDGAIAYITSISDDAVYLYDIATNAVLPGSIALPGGSAPSYGISISTEGSGIYVSHYNANTMSVIDGATRSLLYTTGALFSMPLGIGILCSDLVSGDCSKTIFLTQTSLSNEISWTPIVSVVPVQYEIYRENQLIGSVSSTSYFDRARKKEETFSYTVYAVTSNARTLLGTISVPPCR